MDEHQKTLYFLIITVLFLLVYMHAYNAILITIIFFGFVKIVLMHKKYEWLREKVLDLF